MLNPNRTTTRHIIIKMEKLKERILKAARKITKIEKKFIKDQQKKKKKKKTES